MQDGEPRMGDSELSTQLELRNVLVIKLADLGDLLTATPALRALRQRFSHARISALVTPHTAPLLWENDAVDQILAFPKADFDSRAGLGSPIQAAQAFGRAANLARQLRAETWDAVFLLHHLTTPLGRAKYQALLAATRAPRRFGLDNGSATFLTDSVPDAGFGARHEVEYWLQVVGMAGAQVAEPCLEMTLTEEETAWADGWWRVSGLEGSSVVALHPGSGTFSLARRWPADRFATVGAGLAHAGHQVLVVAGPGEENLAEEVRVGIGGDAVIVAPETTPRRLAAVLRRCQLLVGNDSGVMHLATAVGVPVVGVFGLTNHRAWGPYPPQAHRVVRLDLPCSPCLYPGHGLGAREGCPPRTCLTTLDAGVVLEAARELLRRRC